MTMEIRPCVCKSALSASTLPGLSYSLNPYRGCQHNCAYCYAPCVLRIPREQWATLVEVRTNIPAVLAQELRKKKPGVVGISTVTDPYQPLERTYGLTRSCLEQLVSTAFPAHIQTKSGLVTRDIDLLSQFKDAQVMMSIGTLDERERRLLEPGASSIPERLAALKKLGDAGVNISVFFGPVYPTLTIEDIPEILDIFQASGVSELWIDTLNLKPGIWENIQKTVIQDQRMYHLFVQNVLEQKEHYRMLRDATLKGAQERKMQVIDAF
jgi:DNA repair photolyase